jgi:hypothetical protein
MNSPIFKKCFAILLIFLSAASMTQAQQQRTPPTGGQMYKYYQEYQKFAAGQKCDMYTSGFYKGAVLGLSREGQNKYFTLPNNATDEQLYAVVGKWLENHPESWSEDSTLCILLALKTAFPLR